jgi:hypothetical protein
LIGGVVIGSQFAGFAPHAISTMWETIKKGLFMPDKIITMKTMHIIVGFISGKKSILHYSTPDH